jgi:fumarate reductase subunit D
MSCRELEHLLAEERSLTPEARKHMAECARCRHMMTVLAELETGGPDENLSANAIRPPANLTRVRSLPSDFTLILLTTVVFCLFCVLVSVSIGMNGYKRLEPAERIVYYSVIAVSTLLLSMAFVQSAIPGSKVRVRAVVAVAASVLVTAVPVCAMFRSFGLQHFVSQGVPCLRIGCICAAVFGTLAAAVAAGYGYVTDRARTSVFVGCFAGFSGVAVLSLHCGLLNAAHVMAWHLGTIAIGALAGFAIGALILARR